MKSALLLTSCLALICPAVSAGSEPTYDLNWVIENSHLTESAKNLFISTSPVISDDISKDCGSVEHDSLNITYGCYNLEKQQIFIKAIPREDLAGMMAVTAVHETLHAVYRELPENLKYTINSYIDKEMDGPNRERILDLLKAYKIRDFYNEAHSFIATEIEDIDPEFEEYFSVMIANRRDFVSKYAKSKKLKIQKEKLSELNKELDSLKAKIDLNSEKLSILEKVILPLKDELRILDAEGDFASYNRLIATHDSFTDMYKTLSDGVIADLQIAKEGALSRDALFAEYIKLLATLHGPTKSNSK